MGRVRVDASFPWGVGRRERVGGEVLSLPFLF